MSTVGVLVAVAGAMVLHGQPPPTASTPWDARLAGTGDYQTVFEVSGRGELGIYRVSPDPQDIQSICDASRKTEAAAHSDLEHQVAELEQVAPRGAQAIDLAWARRALGQLYAYEGEMAKSAEQFREAYDIIDRQPAGPEMNGARLTLLQSLGVAELRRGEIENCVHDHNAERCIFPIRGGGVHANRSGSEHAVEALSQALARDPHNLETRWLLNLGYMTLGRYPDGVPATVLIPRDRFDGPAQPRFQDIALERGIDVRNRAGGVVLEDFDNDGRLDVAMSSVGACDPLRIYRNIGGGRFEDVSEHAGVLDQLGGLNLSHVDFDNDGWADLFVHRGGWEAPMRNSLLRNNGNGTFTDVTKAAGLLGTRAHRTHTAAWADYDNDGWVDLFVGHEETASALYHNEKNGTFREVGQAAGVARVAFTKGAAWGDYDNDRYPDLYVSNYVGRNFLYHNRGNGTFEEVAEALGVERPLMSFATWFFDYDNDGWLDLFVASFVPSVTEVVRGFLNLPQQAETMRLYRNNRRGGFENVTEALGLARVMPVMGANFGDINNDGFPDIYLGTGAPSYAALVPNALLRNEGGSRFSDVTTPSGTGHLQKGHGIAFGDVDDDGQEDIVMNVGGFVPGDAYWKTLFHNPGTPNHWLGIRLVGTATNRFAVGARITAFVREPDGRLGERHAVVTSGGSFGASPYRQHIGLGAAAQVERIEILWPATGRRQSCGPIDADQTIEIHEDEATFRRMNARDPQGREVAG